MTKVQVVSPLEDEAKTKTGQSRVTERENRNIRRSKCTVT